jgi:hypothetical protein
VVPSSGAYRFDDAEVVVGVEMREEDVADVEGDAVAHHLALRPFTAVEEHGLAFALERERGDTAFDGGAGSGGSQEAEGEWHGARNIAAEAAASGGRNVPPARRAGATLGRQSVT